MPDVNDLVDVATGDVVLAETDVMLPGVLPLVFERRHRSSPRAGRWFGRSWMSSLDQRLRVTGEQIEASFADGQVLRWRPRGDAGASALPVSGPAWPLRQNPDGSYTVNDPQRGLTWQFEHRAGHAAGELPLTSVTDRAGHEITFSYDGAGRPLGIAHSGGHRLRVSVTGDQVTALTVAGRDGLADVTLRRFEYDGAGNLSGVVDSTGLARRFTYDDAGRVTGRTDRNGHSRRYMFDDEGRCVRVDGPDGVLLGALAFEPGVTRWTNAGGAVTTYEITGSARIAAITDATGKTARTEYDERGRVAAHIDALGRVVRYAYDDRGNLVAVTNPDGRETRVDVDDANLPARITGPDGGVWLQVFDKYGNLTELTAPDGSVLRCGYDARGHLAEVTDANGTVTTVACDSTGLPVAVTEPTGAAVRYERDQLGRVVRITSSDGGTTSCTWTTEGLPVSRTLPDGSTETWAWDGERNLLRRTSATGAVTSYTYSPGGQLASIAWPDGALSEFGYDDGRCLAVVTHGGLRWRYEHDSVGRLSAQTDYNGSTTQYWYDAAGQLVHRVNASGHEASFAYDPIGKLAWHHVADGTVTKFDWDPAGRLLRAWNDDVDLVLVRDVLGRVVSESCNGRTVTLTYDAAGNVTGRVTPSGAATAWAYDAARMPSALTVGGRELRFGHDPAGRETTRKLPGGVVVTQRWDQLGRLVAQDLTGPVAARPLRQRAYTFGPDGFVSTATDALDGDRNFQRDAAGRLTIVTGEGGGHPARYRYDPVGNLVDVAGPAAGVPDLPSQGPREINGTLTARAGNVRYGYDAAGRVISRTRTGATGDPETWRYTWDANSHLYSVTLPDGTRWRYQYDPLGRRIGKRHLAADGALLRETQFSWAGPLLVEQRDLDGDTEKVTTWEYGGDCGVPLTQVSGADFHCVVAGQGGRPTELVAPDGSVAGDATTPWRGPGRYHDRETGLHYHQHRYYDPETGVHLSPAPGALSSGSNPHASAPVPVVVSRPPGLLNGDEAAAVVRAGVSAMRAGTGSGETVLGGTCPAGWTRVAVEHWIGSLLHSSRHLPVAAGVDGFDARLFTGEPILPPIPLTPGE
ncbi:DUF6531 domain-containing protein [Micromonospora sp. NBS 11-29]|uniref:DUF6531 domain-containing protein n=1 Tax=Micromonospora sp. NBS 11-29 TaxID=1960879 RepID=UPI000B78F1F2|nr:DUF6531 domain-containing protein [Micromonospora sp. NBS 11-29]